VAYLALKLQKSNSFSGHGVEPGPRNPKLGALDSLVQALPHSLQTLLLAHVDPGPNDSDGLASGLESLGDLQVGFGKIEDLVRT
jgi:hypothetical protein